MTEKTLFEARTAKVNGVELSLSVFGDPAAPPIVLSHGGGNTMLSWREGFCERLAEGGRYVIRYDSRDSGGSTTYPAGSPGYMLTDLADDAAALIDEVAGGSAHFAGLSQGAGVGQLLALNHPGRVEALTLFSSTPGVPGPATADLPGMAPEIEAMFAEEEEAPEPDWSDRDAVVEYLVEAERPFGAPASFDEEAIRDLAGRVFDRAGDLAANVTNPFIIDSGEPWRARLGEIEVPTLVVHGADDPMFPPAHGEALAREIPGAELLVLSDTGHEYPPPHTWGTVVEAMLSQR